MNMRIGLITAFLLSGISMQAQYKQQLRGTVMDIVLQKPLPGATVTIPSLHLSAITDEDGIFRFREMPIGSYRIIITYSGFKEALLDNITVSSGKETVLTISLEALVKVEEEVSVKTKPLTSLQYFH